MRKLWLLEKDMKLKNYAKSDKFSLDGDLGLSTNEGEFEEETRKPLWHLSLL